MRILIITQYFWPESFRINDLAQGLKERGNDVTVLTGKPNYPEGKFYEGYSFLAKSYEEWDKIKIYRVPLVSRGKGGAVRLFLNYISFCIAASFRVLWIKKNFDRVFVYEPSPITVGIPAVVLKILFKKKFYFWVQDLWPASITAAGSVKSRFVIQFFDLVTRMIYGHASKVLVQSRAFIPYIVNQGISEKKIIYFPNSTDIINHSSQVKVLSEYKIPESFVLMFAGNIGNSQSFETLIEAAKILKERKFKVSWVILGDGRMRNEVERQIKLIGLQDCFFLIGRFPPSEMPSFYASADALLLSLKRSEIFSYTIPSKLQSYMSFGKPIIASLDGEGARVISEAGAGYVSPAEDAIGLADNIAKAISTDKQILQQMANNALAYYEQQFERESLITKLLEILEDKQL